MSNDIETAPVSAGSTDKKTMARILLADDDPSVREMLHRVLAAADFDVIECADGEEAVERATEAPVDVAVLDVVMPRLDGLGAIKPLRSVAPGIVIIAISGGGRSGRVDVLEAAEKLGADATMTKPFTPKELIQLIQAKLDACASQSDARNSEPVDVWTVE